MAARMPSQGCVTVSLRKSAGLDIVESGWMRGGRADQQLLKALPQPAPFAHQALCRHVHSIGHGGGAGAVRQGRRSRRWWAQQGGMQEEEEEGGGGTLVISFIDLDNASSGSDISVLLRY